MSGPVYNDMYLVDEWHDVDELIGEHIEPELIRNSGYAVDSVTEVDVPIPLVPTAPGDRMVGGSHYLEIDPQPATVIEKWYPGYRRGRAINYILRAGKKGNTAEDLRKAIHLLEMELEELE